MATEAQAARTSPGTCSRTDRLTLRDEEVARPAERPVLVRGPLADARVDVPAIVARRELAGLAFELPRLLEPIARLQRPDAEDLPAADDHRAEAPHRRSDSVVELHVVIGSPHNGSPRQLRRALQRRPTSRRVELCSGNDADAIGGLVAGVVEDADGVVVLDLVRQASILEARGETLEDRRRIGAGGSGRAVDLDRLRIRGCAPGQRRRSVIPIESDVREGGWSRVVLERWRRAAGSVPGFVGARTVDGGARSIRPGVGRIRARADARAAVGSVERHADRVVVPAVAVRRT